LTHENIIEGLFDLSAGIWLLLTLTAFRMVKNGLHLYRINATLLGCLFLFLSIKGGAQENKIMWSFSFPLIALYTLGRKEGLVLSAALYFLVVAVLYAPLNFVHAYAYAAEFKIRFCVVFFLVASLTYIYESVREHSQTNLEGERNKLETEKSKLSRLSSALQEATRHWNSARKGSRGPRSLPR